MSEDVIYPATFFVVYPSGSLAMDHCQIIRKSRDRTYRHAMRDQNNGHATLSRNEIECQTVRIAVTGHNCQVEAAALKDLEVTRVVSNKFDNTQGLEEVIASKSSHEPEDTPRRETLAE